MESRLFGRLLPYPGVFIRIGFKLGTVDIDMLKVYLLFLKDCVVDVGEDILDGDLKDLIDEVAEGTIRRRLTVHKIHEAEIDSAVVFHFSQRAVSAGHKSEEYRF